MHHAYVIEADSEEGIERALGWAEAELGLRPHGNPDVLVLRHGLFSVDDARRVQELAMQTAVGGESRLVVIAASRIYHEAQNALLKLFEEPAPGTYLVLVLPSLGGLLPTLRSRVQTLSIGNARAVTPDISDDAQRFLTGTIEERSALVKKLTSGKDEDARRENRDRAIAVLNGIEIAAARVGVLEQAALLGEIQILRGHLYDRSAPVKQILEHLAIVTPKGLV